MNITNIIVWHKIAENNHVFYGPFDSEPEVNQFISDNNIVVDNDSIRLYTLTPPENYS